MIDLKRCKGTYKGMIGECMFKLSRKNACLTKFWNKYRYVDTFRRYFQEEQVDFLMQNWTSLDCIEFISYRPYLFEIKTRNKYLKDLGFRQKVTQSTVDTYGKAKRLGFKIYLAEVIFLDNWQYEVLLKRFEPANYCVDREKPYDKK